MSNSNIDLKTQNVNNNNTEEITITKETIKRLASDIKTIIKEPLDNHGIYYKHDEEDILKGYALIIGRPDTAYAYGCYLFEFTFPYNYPYSPPIVKFCLSDGATRFNPNFYVRGKVCLSVLNTWKGDQWTGCQTISSILLVLSTVFTDNANNPLLNEPGIYESHRDCSNYKKIITYKNIELSILKLISEKANVSITSGKYNVFYDIIINHFLDNYDNIINIINSEATPGNNIVFISTSIYNMTTRLNYNSLRITANTLKKKFLDLRKEKK